MVTNKKEVNLLMNSLTKLVETRAENQENKP